MKQGLLLYWEILKNISYSAMTSFSVVGASCIISLCPIWFPWIPQKHQKHYNLCFSRFSPRSLCLLFSSTSDIIALHSRHHISTQLNSTRFWLLLSTLYFAGGYKFYIQFLKWKWGGQNYAMVYLLVQHPDIGYLIVKSPSPPQYGVMLLPSFWVKNIGLVKDKNLGLPVPISFRWFPTLSSPPNAISTLEVSASKYFEENKNKNSWATPWWRHLPSQQCWG